MPTSLVTCARCSAVWTADMRFCGSCGAPLVGERVAAGVRKTVTAVFCDVNGSTLLGERLDPEALRGLMEAYFAGVSDALVRHGGTVEKFVGDAVMAVFGVPVAHEDDAVRACRAATEMLACVDEADRRIAQAHGVRLQVRIGVETGEVVVGDPSRGSTFASGSAVNTAARLEQAAGSGECLIGPQCYRLVRDLVEVETRAGLALKGFAGPVTGYRLIGENGGAVPIADGPMSAFLGRVSELAVLRHSFERGVTDRTGQLVTVLGIAGSGKTRLAAEFLRDVGASATVLRGRCLSYGEGVTYWPLVEVVRQAAGLTGAESEAEARARVAALLPADAEVRRVLDLVAPAAGLGGAPGSVEDTAWAVQRLLAAMSGDRPVILIIDDLHWAEPGLLSIVDGISDRSRDVAVMVLVLARPELLDDTPDWGAGRSNAVAVSLPPLRDDEVDSLTVQLLAGRALAAGVADRVRETAGGNPLFVEQLLAMLTEGDELDRDPTVLKIPPTIGALLTARLDRLPSVERAVIGSASVIGQTFYPAAVTELSEESAEDVATALEALLHKALIHPEQSDLPDQQALRFDHVLVRDAAYRALSKDSRARLHERFAWWLDEHSEGQAYADFIGAHLEAAYLNRVALGPPDAAARQLGEEGAVRLAAAGRSLLIRDDLAAVALLTRALALHPNEDPGRWPIQFNLAEGLVSIGRLHAAAELTASLSVAADAAGDLLWTTHARLLLAAIGLSITPEGAGERLKHEAEEALVVFDRLGDELGLGLAHMYLGEVTARAGQLSRSTVELEIAADHLIRVGRSWLVGEVMFNVRVHATRLGAQHASVGLAVARQYLLEAGEGNEPVPRLVTWTAIAFFAALLGHSEEEHEARDHADRAGAELGDSGMEHIASVLGVAALARGRAAEASELFARSCELNGANGDVAAVAMSAAYNSHSLLLRGDVSSAREQISLALETSATDDVLIRGVAHSAAAWVAALDGEDPATVFRHMTDALAALEPTEFVLERGLVHAACAEAARLIGDDASAHHHRQTAIDLYEAKGNVVGAAVQRGLLQPRSANGGHDSNL